MANDLEEVFLKSPIARWTWQFYTGERNLSLAVFCNGEFLFNDVWAQIVEQDCDVNPASDDVIVRTRILQRLLESMLNFYKNHLEQVLVLKLPDVLVLAQYSESTTLRADATRQVISELTSLLLLLLGCAVQCDRKEDFITSIKTLDVGAQHSLMESIQQIADNPGAVWPRDGGIADDAAMYAALVDNVKRLTDERDSLAAQCVQLTLDRMTFKEPPPSPGVNDNSGLKLELADTKSKLRKIQRDLEEKMENLSDSKEEVEQLRENLQRLRQENVQLVQESRCAKALRDEIDYLKEKCVRYETIEATMQRYKEKISDLDFLRSRCEELKEDLRVTNETKFMLEEQLEASRKKLETLVSLESELVSMKVQLSETQLERDFAGERLTRLAEENSQLHVDKKNLVEEISRLQPEMSHHEDEEVNNLTFEGPSLLEQMHNDTMSRCSQLELEREKLSCSMQEKDRDNDKLQNDILTLNLEVRQLQKKLELAQADCTKLNDCEQQLSAVSVEKTRLQRQAESLEKRLEESQQELVALRSENSRLTSSLTTMKGTMQRLNQMEKDKTEIESRNKELENERRQADRELQRARQNLDERNQEVDKLSDKLAAAEKLIASLREDSSMLEIIREEVATSENLVHSLKEQLSMERAALSDLRQDMIQQKVKNGLLENELEQIHIQLDNVERQQKEQAQNQQTRGSSTDEFLSTASSLNSGTEINEGSTTLSSPVESERLDTEILMSGSLPALNLNGDLNPTAIGGTVSFDSSAGLLSLPAHASSEPQRESVSASARVIDLKEKIVQLEHKKTLSENECTEAKKKLSTIKQQLLNAEYEIAQEVSKREALAKQNAALQSHFARLEVDQSVAISAKQQLQEQTEVLKQELGEVKSKLREKELEVIKAMESQDKIAKDYQILDTLHKQLGIDFEKVKDSLTDSKNIQKSQKNEIAELQRMVIKLKAQLESTKEELREKSEVASSMELLQSLSGSSAVLTDDNSRLRNDLENLQGVYKQLKDECNQQSLKITQLQGELRVSRDDLSTHEIDVSRLTASYKMLQQINKVLEEERQNLLVKVTSLMASYDQHFVRLLDVISTCDSNGQSANQSVSSYERERRRMEEERKLLEDKLSEYTSKIDNSNSVSKAISSRSSTPLPGDVSSRNVTPSPQPPVHVSRTVENHTTVNVVNQVHHYPAQPLTSTPYGGLSRSPTTRHSMYARRSTAQQIFDNSQSHDTSRGSSTSGTQLFRTTLKKEAAAAFGSGNLSDIETPSRRSVVSSTVNSPAQTGSNTPTKQDVWYEYGCV